MMLLLRQFIFFCGAVALFTAIAPYSMSLADEAVNSAIESEAAEYSQRNDAGAEKSKEVKGLPQLDFSTYPSQIFWLFIMFTLLYFIFSKKTLPEISSTIENRREQVDGDLENAQELKEEAEKVQAEYEAALEEARNKCTEMFKKSEDKIKEKANKQLQDFKDRSVKAMAETENLVEKSKDSAIADMHTIAAEVASLAAEKIVGISTDLDAAKSFVKNIDRKAA